MPITNFDKVELLLSMTGANNGTLFPDYSLRQRVVTRAGATLPVTVTAQSAFAGYGSSMFSASATSAVPGNLRFTNPGWFSGAFTVEGWVRVPATNSFSFLLDLRNNSTYTAANADNAGKFALYLRGTTNALALNYGASSTVLEGGSFAGAAFNHIAACRDGSNVLRLFLGGTQVASDTISNNFNNPYASIGFASSATTNDQWFNDICITDGVAKYTANFTPERMTQRTLTRANTGVDSHEYDRAVLFDWNTSAYTLKTATPDSEGDFVADDLIDLEYGVAFIKDDCGPICRGPFEVDPDA